MKNAVIYYSNTNESKRVAEYLAKKLDYKLIDVTVNDDFSFTNAVLVFPVYCQNIPVVVDRFLKRLTTQTLAVIATYGKMSCGNVIYEINKKYNFNIIAAAYVPTKHAYINEERFDDFNSLDVITEKLQQPSSISIPKLRKNPLANILKGLRSRIGIKIIKKNLCDGCGLCERICSMHAVKFGKPNGKCIRCLKCVTNCPQKALQIKVTPLLAVYLKKKKRDKLIIYV